MTLIDNLRVYNIDLKEAWIQAEAAPALGGVEPNFVQLGCDKCGLKKAASACPQEYHLCTTVELYTAGYHVARSMGWVYIIIFFYYLKLFFIFIPIGTFKLLVEFKLKKYLFLYALK